MQGYANPGQFAGGILNRLYARALLVADEQDPSCAVSCWREDGGVLSPCIHGQCRFGVVGLQRALLPGCFPRACTPGSPFPRRQRWVFVNLDACMASQAVTFTVLDRLRQRYGDQYTEQNVGISGTHTHSGPSGYLQYLVYGIASLGFYSPTFDALVDGIVKARPLGGVNVDGRSEWAIGCWWAIGCSWAIGCGGSTERREFQGGDGTLTRLANRLARRRRYRTRTSDRGPLPLEAMLVRMGGLPGTLPASLTVHPSNTSC